MREVTIKLFHQNMWKEVETLPLAITRKGKITFEVWPPDKQKDKTIPLIIKEKEDVKKAIETVKAVEGEKLGWCDFVSAQGFGRRCSNKAVVRLPNGNYCEEHV